MNQQVAIYVRRSGTELEPLLELQQTVENRVDTAVVATYCDDGRITGHGKYAGWRSLLAHLVGVDQIALINAGDIPGKTLADLLKILAVLRDHHVGLSLHNERIDTASTTFAMLDIIGAYRRAKLSQAIRKGQEKAVAAGKRVGRPIVPSWVRDRILAALAEGGGIRPTARRFNVSPASVINIRRSMPVTQCTSC